MAEYPNNYGGIISAIQACIVAAGGTLTQEYPKNTGGIIAALVTLQGALGTGGSGASIALNLTVGEDVSKGDALYIQNDGKVYKAENDDTREKATVLGFAKEDAVQDTEVAVVTRGSLENTGSYAATTQYFLSDTAGGVTTTAPSTAGEFSVLVGEGLSDDKIDIKISTPIELS